MGAEFYTLFSSSKGNSAFLRCGNDRILIDAGVSARSVGQALSCVGSSLSELSAIFITHEHSDHIKGLATITKKTDIPVFAPAACLPFLAERVADPSRLFPLASGRVVKVGGVAVCPVATPRTMRWEASASVFLPAASLSGILRISGIFPKTFCAGFRAVRGS